MRTFRLEVLELRTHLDATLNNGLLTVTGTDNPDNIQINPSGADIVVDIGGVTTPFTAADVAQIRIEALGGADTIAVNVVRPTTILGGAGVDNITGSDGGNDDVFGNTGNDTFNGRGGDDTFTWNPGDGNDIIDGDAGTDTHIFNGSGGDEIMNVGPNGARVTLTRNLGNIIMDIGGFENVTINALGGNDDVSGAAGLSPLVTLLTIDGGAGNDIINGGNGADLLLGGEDDDQIDGNAGNDTARMGGGGDTFTWDPGDGSDLVEGEAGFDTLRFNGSAGAEIFDASANGSRLRFTRNLGNIVMDVGTTEKIDLNALGGNDATTINSLAGTGVAEVFVDAGDGNDSFVGSSLAETFLGGADDDTARFGDGDFLDMGSGNDELQFFGTTGRDVIQIDRKQRGTDQEIRFFGNVGGGGSAIFNNGERITVFSVGGNDKVKLHKRAEQLWDLTVVP